jgi:hypothetical protein
MEGRFGSRSLHIDIASLNLDGNLMRLAFLFQKTKQMSKENSCPTGSAKHGCPQNWVQLPCPPHRSQTMSIKILGGESKTQIPGSYSREANSLGLLPYLRICVSLRQGLAI